MKSKSFDLKKSPTNQVKLNKTFDFVGLYKSAAETNVKLLDKHKCDIGYKGENSSPSVTNASTPNDDRLQIKQKKKTKNEALNVSHVSDIYQTSFQTEKEKLSVNNTRTTSTPNASAKVRNVVSKVKSIMKTSSTTDDTMDVSNIETSPHKPKKRNKSVSFMLDDTEGVVVKKTKNEDSVVNNKVDNKHTTKENKNQDKKRIKKFKKLLQAEKENKGSTNVEADQSVAQKSEESRNKPKTKSNKTNVVAAEVLNDSPATDSQLNHVKKKRYKKGVTKMKFEVNSEQANNLSNDNAVQAENTVKKLKKKKCHAKQTPVIDINETEGEPANKSRKKETKADVIAVDLENLSIGDNAHSLTNLLDEMTVVDKEKRKKNKQRHKKDNIQQPTSISSSEATDLEKIEEGKEKVRWKKRKWNKDKKGDMDEDVLITSIIVENLPLKIMCSYKKLLGDHFGKCGLIKKIGIAELYPTEEPKPVFTTTIIFYSEGAALKALEEDNMSFEGARIHVKRPLPATDTTLVVRSYAELTEQNLSSVFISAGRIRSIRHLVKGRKSMATAFIEFDGPTAVERAIKMAEDAKIFGKKIHVSKFEHRTSKSKDKRVKSIASENEGDTDDSND